MPTWGFSSRLPSEAMTPLPRYSGYRTVQGSSTWTKPRRAGAEGAVALAVGVGGGDPDHLLAADELDHPLVQPVEHLLLVEAAGTLLRSVAALERMLAAGARREGLGLVVRRGRFAHVAMMSGRVAP
jgi:hypothetical protein